MKSGKNRRKVRHIQPGLGRQTADSSPVSPNPSQSPLTYGILHPVVLLPEGSFTQSQLRFILTHELTHIKHLDGVRKTIANAALILHWYNPLVWLMHALYNRDIELAVGCAPDGT